MLPTTHTTHIVRKGNKLLELTQKQVVYECRIGLAFNIAKDDMQTSRLVGFAVNVNIILREVSLQVLCLQTLGRMRR